MEWSLIKNPVLIILRLEILSPRLRLYNLEICSVILAVFSLESVFWPLLIFVSFSSALTHSLVSGLQFFASFSHLGRAPSTKHQAPRKPNKIQNKKAPNRSCFLNRFWIENYARACFNCFLYVSKKVWFPFRLRFLLLFFWLFAVAANEIVGTNNCCKLNGLLLGGGGVYLGFLMGFFFRWAPSYRCWLWVYS